MSNVAEKREVFTNIGQESEYNVEDAKKKVLDFLGCEPPRKTCGFRVLVALYTRKDKKLQNSDGTESVIITPDSVGQEDKYRSCTGLVVQMGAEAYQGERFKYDGAWCRVGDWVTITRHDGVQFDYRGKPCMLLNDDKIGMVVDEPAFVQRGSY